MDPCCTRSDPGESSSACCGGAREPPRGDDIGEQPWIVGHLETPLGKVPRVATELSRADRLGAIGVRLNIRRMNYAIQPEVYAVGDPTPDSPVLVSANYKLSFDHLRREMGGLDAWILVIDTKGVNVWCAAGKGTFGTDEIVRRVELTRLAERVNHRKLIVPQLGAPGVAAHEVKRRTHFGVTYGPVRAEDIPAFVAAGMQATPEMRRVRFDLWDRLVVMPVELVLWGRYALVAMACLFLLGGVSRQGYDSTHLVAIGGRAALLVWMAYLCGGLLTPMLLPWLPGRAFSVKGAVAGVLLAAGVVLGGWLTWAGLAGLLETLSWVLLMPAISAFLAMNYTGASTYTSLSGVKREMRIAVPAQIAAAVIGSALWLAARCV